MPDAWPVDHAATQALVSALAQLDHVAQPALARVELVDTDQAHELDAHLDFPSRFSESFTFAAAFSVSGSTKRTVISGWACWRSSVRRR